MKGSIKGIEIDYIFFRFAKKEHYSNLLRNCPDDIEKTRDIIKMLSTKINPDKNNLNLD